MEFHHVPVLLNEVLDVFDIKPGKIAVDCTVGGAGHSTEILKRLLPGGTLVCFDRDKKALSVAEERLKKIASNVFFVHDNYKNLSPQLSKLGIKGVDYILFDLGVSSYQLDNPERGFSYMKDAPLDMRMDQRETLTAKDLVNELEEKELMDIIWKFGEERWAKRIAEKIVSARKIKKIETTFELVDIIKAAIPKGARKKGPHPAKRTFQALRIAVNEELKGLDLAIRNAVKCLNPGGIIAVITFHSLEDRIIKDTFNFLAKDCICPPELPICQCNHEKVLQVITRKPVIPSENELKENPRARSAKLRAAKKVHG